MIDEEVEQDAIEALRDGPSISRDIVQPLIGELAVYGIEEGIWGEEACVFTILNSGTTILCGGTS